MRTWVEQVTGPIHRRANGHVLAFAAAGLFVRMKLNLAVYNVKYGPHSKCGNAQLFREVAAGLSDNCSPNEPSLRMLWPKICVERGMDPVLRYTDVDRLLFLATLEKGGTFITSKPRKASVSMFSSYSHAAQHMDGDWTAQCWFLSQL